MKTKVIFIGDTEMIDFPFIVDSDNWLIPKGWYLLQDELQNRPTVVYNEEKKPIIIIEHIQINYTFEGVDNRMSVIKTDRKLDVEETIVYK